MVKDHSDSEREPTGYVFPNSSKGSFICTIQDRIAHTMALLRLILVEESTMRDALSWNYVHTQEKKGEKV